MKPAKIAVLLLLLPALLGAATPGESLYRTHCASCHSASLRGSAHGAALTGKLFLDRWGNQRAMDLLQNNMDNMPPGEAHTLSRADHIAITRYIIERNAGSLTGEELLLSATMLDEGAAGDEPAAIEFSGAESVMDMARNAGQFTNRVLPKFSPVQPSDLLDPSDADWLN